jgi:hypothetical protein
MAAAEGFRAKRGEEGTREEHLYESHTETYVIFKFDLLVQEPPKCNKI